MYRNTFHKEERLKSRKSIETLFLSGKSISSPPFRLLYRKLEIDQVGIKMAVAVPKKQIKRAVDRNLLKRRTREVYRKIKHLLYKSLENTRDGYEILFLYQANEISDFIKIQNSINFLIKKLIERIEKE